MPQDFLGRILFILDNYLPSLLRGAGTTILVALVGTFFGCIIGFIIGIIQTIPLEKNDSLPKKAVLRALRLVLYCYVEVFRGTPMLVQAMFIYYGSMELFGIDMSMWFAAFFIVSINTGAYMAEVVRGGILSVDRGQYEAAKAVGMNHVQTMVHVVLPVAIRNILPATGNEFIINIKDTSVLNIIGVTELFFQSRTVAGVNFMFFETYFITSLIYLFMTFTITRILRIVERKMDGSKTYQLNQQQV